MIPKLQQMGDTAPITGFFAYRGRFALTNSQEARGFLGGCLARDPPNPQGPGAAIHSAPEPNGRRE